MEEKFDITICLGSSCFSRGNKQTVQIIKDWIQENKLEEQVYFHGGHCFGSCEKGPVLKINDRIYYGIEPTDVRIILNESFKSSSL